MAVSDNRRSRVFPDPRTNRALSRSTHCVRYPGFFALLPASGCTCRVSIFCRRRTRKHTHTHTHNPSLRSSLQPPASGGTWRWQRTPQQPNKTKQAKQNKQTKQTKQTQKNKQTKQTKNQTNQTFPNYGFKPFVFFGFWFLGFVCVFGVFLCLLVSKSSFQS